MAIITTSELVIGQWAGSPKLRALIDIGVDPLRTNVVTALERLKLMRSVETAEGVWLDYIGLRVGLRRPVTADPAADERFGFEGPSQSRGFDLAPFKGDVANDAVYPLNDGLFRKFIKARALLVLGDGTFATFAKAVKLIDPGASVQDKRNMTVRVVTSIRSFLELADSNGALPRTAGVMIEYADRGRFGFDNAGVSFDQGAFTNI